METLKGYFKYVLENLDLMVPDQKALSYFPYQIIQDGYYPCIDIQIPNSNKICRIKRYRPAYMLTTCNEYYDLSNGPRSVFQIGYVPMKGIRHDFDLKSLKNEIYTSTFYESNIIDSIFSYVDSLQIDIWMNCIHTHPDSLTFEEYRKMDLNDTFIQYMVQEFSKEIPIYQNAFYNVVPFITKTLQEMNFKNCYRFEMFYQFDKMKNFTIHSIKIYDSSNHSSSQIFTRIDYQVLYEYKDHQEFRNDCLILQTNQDGIPKGIVIYKNQDLTKSGYSLYEKQSYLTYQNIDRHLRMYVAK
jgi:hypothetical protein